MIVTSLLQTFLNIFFFGKDSWFRLDEKILAGVLKVEVYKPNKKGRLLLSYWT